jgi:hypothetical protein
MRPSGGKSRRAGEVIMKVKKGTVEMTIIMDDDGDIRYYHPLTNQACETLSQCFAGWSEQSEADSKEWSDLAALINSGDIDQYIEDDVDYTED